MVILKRLILCVHVAGLRNIAGAELIETTSLYSVFISSSASQWYCLRYDQQCLECWLIVRHNDMFMLQERVSSNYSSARLEMVS